MTGFPRENGGPKNKGTSHLLNICTYDRYNDFILNRPGILIENMLIAIKALGYESCWYEGHTDDDNIAGKLADRLHVPEEYKLVCVLPVGYANEQVETTKHKKAFDERAWFNGFKKQL